MAEWSLKGVMASVVGQVGHLYIRAVVRGEVGGTGSPDTVGGAGGLGISFF